MTLVSFRDQLKRSQKWSLGLMFLACVIVLWVLSSFLLNGLFENGIYAKPFFITWINTSAFIFYLIPFYIRHRNGEDSQLDAGTPSGIDDITSNGSLDETETDVYSPQAVPIEDTDSDNGTSALMMIDSHVLEPLTFLETINLAFFFCVLWFLSNLLNNASLIFTSVSSQTILASTSSFFTIVIGYLVHLELLSKAKVLSIILSIIGVILVTCNDNPVTEIVSRNNIMWGNLLALGGALCYGVYSILLKLNVKEDSRIDMKLFFGFVGVFNLFLLWPPIVIMDKLGYEKFELPPNSYVYLIIFTNCAASFLADFLWARAMLLTSPLTVTVGLSMTIPVAMVCDFIFKFRWNSPIYMLGAAFICISFYTINRDEQADNNRRLD